ncbi:MAG: integrase core domain-containing protein [Pseudomonadota bacterium]|nr:integrase core domain-containing protein [Pseudomonadota bacterium]
MESIQHAARAIGDWIRLYNTRRPHQALVVRTPAEASRLTARSEQTRLVQ